MKYLLLFLLLSCSVLKNHINRDKDNWHYSYEEFKEWRKGQIEMAKEKNKKELEWWRNH